MAIDPALSAVLVALAITVLTAAAGTAVVFFNKLSEQIKTQGLAITKQSVVIEDTAQKVADNTVITKQTRAASDGMLSREKKLSTDLGALLTGRQERMAYLLAKHPEIEATLHEFDARQLASVVVGVVPESFAPSPDAPGVDAPPTSTEASTPMS